MIAISNKSVDELVKDFLKSQRGQKLLKQQGISYSGYTDDELKEAARELKSMISNAFIAEQKAENNPHFDDSKVRIRVAKKNDKMTTLHIQYPKATLARPSLSAPSAKHAQKGYNRSGVSGNRFTGEGIYDIFALFTTGYELKGRRPVGYWWDDNEGGERITSTISRGGRDPDLVIAPKRRKPSNFITNAITAFKNKYPNIEVNYPDEWK